MSELGVEPKELGDMDKLRPHLQQMLKPYLPKVYMTLNDKQLIDKLIENKIEHKS